MKLPQLCVAASLVINLLFSADSVVWSAAPVQLDWTCFYTNVVYKITHILFFPERTLQLTLHDTTTVHFHYRSTQWTEFVLFFYQLSYIHTSNQWYKVRYLNLNRHLQNLYKAPRNFKNKPPKPKTALPPCRPLQQRVAPVKTLPYALSTH